LLSRRLILIYIEGRTHGCPQNSRGIYGHDDQSTSRRRQLLIEDTAPADIFIPEDFSDDQKMFVQTARSSSATKSSPAWRRPSTKNPA